MREVAGQQAGARACKASAGAACKASDASTPATWSQCDGSKPAILRRVLAVKVATSLAELACRSSGGCALLREGSALSRANGPRTSRIEPTATGVAAASAVVWRLSTTGECEKHDASLARTLGRSLVIGGEKR